MSVSKKVAERIATQLKKYQGILSDARDRDISESDTVVIVGDMLADVFGYRKYTEITTEFAVRSTYVDIAVKIGNDVRFLIEGKAIGVPLKETHVRQAVDYGVNHGVEWIVLTNGVMWQVYKIHFKQPVDKSLIFEIDLLQANPKSNQIIECFGNLSREGFTRSTMTAFFQQSQVTNKFSIAALLLSDQMLTTLRREIRRISPGCKVETDELKTTLQAEVLKRELLDGDGAKQAVEFLKKAFRSVDRAKIKDDGGTQDDPPSEGHPGVPGSPPALGKPSI